MLQKLDINDFDRVYSLMEKSFPTDERRPYSKQKALLDDPLYSIYGVKSDSGDITAFITVWQFESFAYVEHFAVDPDCRGSGIGSAVLKEIVSELSCLVCLEVELPETDMAKRRIAFYERNGFVTNDYPYIQPPYSEEQSPLPLIIMTSGRTVSEDEFKEMKGLLYKNVYKVK
ncbi:MAG: GNAT family N-acetyltransferase [Oscillospiraceae bacterium]|nr:GNAT family N-acetyltransferase [Oscillospiraceae bacterium]